MHQGELTIYGGPMFAGKTTALISHARTLPQGSFVVVKPSMDTRFSESDVVTHDGDRIASLPVNVSAPDFTALDFSHIKTILLDELNFFQPLLLIPKLEELRQQGINIVGSGLLYDFMKHEFGATKSLAERADTFVQLYARCDKCGRKATQSYRKVASTSQVLVGAADTYGAACDSCWEILQK